MNYEEAKDLLAKHGQLQLLEYYGGLTEEQKSLLLDDISKINFGVVGHLNESDKTNDGGEYKCPPAKDLKDIAENRRLYEAEGLKLLKAGKVGAVLLAGGQGTRLGYDKPKGTFNIGETRTLTIFGQLMNNIKEVTDLYGGYFHLFIMTSSVNDGQTRSFFVENGYFGYPPEKIHFYIQDTEPVCGFDGKIFLSEKHRVALAPNGNGGWYSSLVNSGLSEIISAQGIEWLNIFSVDNVLQRICDPAFIGATLLSGKACGAKVVCKTCPEEKVGVLTERGGEPCVLEYFEIPPELAEKTDRDGNLVYRYGVILNYLFNVGVLNEIYRHKLPYHVAKKAVPHIVNGVTVKPEKPNACKFETLVVDMVRYMGSCLAYEVEREIEFAPVKNKTGVDSVDTARRLLKLNGVKL